MGKATEGVKPEVEGRRRPVAVSGLAAILAHRARLCWQSMMVEQPSRLQGVVVDQTLNPDLASGPLTQLRAVVTF
ncbi:MULTISPECIES: hypothetical protein [unclassified Chelatococcus]|uniref:hypothetical protein n=1 Tax=unclassified Chelatococcus TaxID=2638111 RepID=UPI001BCC8E1C|nr:MULTISPECIES: hypothetical protein [unclassified Chelatococcus]MBS7699411.1 hypothetical protein [Chelatococcus sp. YT9]MBX3557697.1 hypothetical protein [Chelatococcus sp.]